MGKRKANGDDKQASKDKMDVDGELSGSEDDTEMLDVDFEFFNPDSEVDFHGLKNLLRQLFDADNQLFDLSALAGMILEQQDIGTTIKCDGKESDPYAFMTILNLYQHRSKAVIQQLTNYILSRVRASGDQSLANLEALLSEKSSARVGLILTERFINMPHQVIPPLYNMLLEEMQLAVEDKKPYEFTHYIVMSKTYTEVESKLDAEDNPPSKKKKAGASSNSPETFFFHPEDEVLHRYALGWTNFDYETQGDEGASDSRRVFTENGIKPQGHLTLMESEKFKDAVKAVGEYLSAE
ncbi:uncharacterized protein MYCFIDRAFT_190822 [Pseudocercospora fijiensis CIRAD86]|uniref:Protein BCP1 n=1 Tax=Pseudocercospora fijiensis (strain CIRAD86) TaxID=383855 RepID=M3AMA2_PSEFD|nr:uncharacterized protein MYCFIDRAFT_190822 [Pseudocercospora fijiensis CIRAD86]EME78592.1 hypothetical protein MYCFIDRAFT_190822 [Pseudocercospora fijiensis CIRAD86]